MNPCSPSRFMDIPENIRTRFINNLPQPQVLLLRCLNKQLKNEVDASYIFQITTKPSTSKKCQKLLSKLRISNCTLKDLSPRPLYKPNTPTTTTTSTTPTPTTTTSTTPTTPTSTTPTTAVPLGHQTLFKHPNELKSLTIETKNIRTTDYNSLLEECSHYLSTFHITFNHTKKDEFTRLSTTLAFENLKDLFVEDHRNSPKVKPDLYDYNAENDVLLNILVNIDSKSLTKLNVQLHFRGFEVYKLAIMFTFLFFQTISQQSALQVINFIHSNPYLLDNRIFQKTIENFNFNPIAFRGVINVRKISVDYFRSFTPAQGTLNTWKYLIRTQRKLEHLFLDEVGPILEDSFLRDAVQNNLNTLKHLEIWFSKGEIQIDMKIFEKCKTLEVLILAQFNEKVRLEAINFTLPESLVKLELRCLSLITSEIQEYFKRKTQLESVIIRWGSAKCKEYHKGVNAFVLDLILNQPKLLSLRIQEFIVFFTREFFKLQESFKEFSGICLQSYESLEKLDLCLRREGPQQPFYLFHPSL